MINLMTIMMMIKANGRGSFPAFAFFYVDMLHIPSHIRGTLNREFIHTKGSKYLRVDVFMIAKGYNGTKN
ncbi:hypothetical protein [Peribacillus sp. NPDC056705]|uniref:hypothetical protein n=1 Tax=Peribacillus sp. NPDC056705 TaxID=3345918 RepID=UPI00374A62A3